MPQSLPLPTVSTQRAVAITVLAFFFFFGGTEIIPSSSDSNISGNTKENGAELQEIKNGRANTS